MNNNIHRLLAEARKLIATMDPQPGHPLDEVDAMIHAALMEMERGRQQRRRLDHGRTWNEPHGTAKYHA